MDDFWDGFWSVFGAFLLTAPVQFIIACILGYLAKGR